MTDIPRRRYSCMQPDLPPFLCPCALLHRGGMRADAPPAGTTEAGPRATTAAIGMSLDKGRSRYGTSEANVRGGKVEGRS
jgi:hypothetical protein